MCVASVFVCLCSFTVSCMCCVWMVNFCLGGGIDPNTVEMISWPV